MEKIAKAISSSDNWGPINQHKAMIQEFEKNRSFLSQIHVNFLNSQRESIRQLGALIKVQATSTERLLAKPSDSHLEVNGISQIQDMSLQLSEEISNQ
jgi:hypothetical protein